MWEIDVSVMGMWLEDPKFIQNKNVVNQAKSHFKKLFNEAHHIEEDKNEWT